MTSSAGKLKTVNLQLAGMYCSVGLQRYLLRLRISLDRSLIVAPFWLSASR